jgi:ankyrin
LWVKLQLDALERCGPHGVEDALGDLPTSLDKTYERILERFPPHPTMITRVRHAFECIAFAKRPLSPAEVVEILSVSFDTSAGSSDDLESLTSAAKDPEMSLRTMCPSLIDIIEAKDGRKVVQFIHFSVQQHLTSDALAGTELPARLYRFDDRSANASLARICIIALDVDSPLSHFRHYADQFWFEHISPRVADSLNDIIPHFLHHSSPSFSRWTLNRRSPHSVHTDTALHWAAKLGLSTHVKTLLESGYEVDLLDSDDATPLFRAASSGHLDVIRLLLESGADCKAQPSFSRDSVLHYAIRSVPPGPVITFLIKSGAIVDAARIDGTTALHEASWWDIREAASTLLDHKADIHALAGGQTPLHRTVWCNRSLLADLLLSRGASVDYSAAGDRCTPLHYAAAFGFRETLLVLLNHGAEANARTTGHTRLGANAGDIDIPSGSTPLHCASSSGLIEISRILLVSRAHPGSVDDSGVTPLHRAAQYGRTEMACFLLDWQRDTSEGLEVLGVCDERGLTPLHYAAGAAHVETIQSLLERGALVDVTDKYDNTPLHLAAHSGHLDVIRILLQHRVADLESDNPAVLRCRARDCNGRTPLHDAAGEGHTEVLRFLLEQLVIDAPNDVASVCNTRDCDGRTALHNAAGEGHVEVSRFLLAHGAFVDSADQYGNTPLHLAAHSGHLDTALILLEHLGADLGPNSTAVLRCCARDSDGRTPLHDAAGEGHAEISRFLLEHLATNAPDDIVSVCNVGDCNGWTALHDAANKGHVEVSRLLLTHGALVDSVDQHNNTPLHLAARSQHTDNLHTIFEFLATIPADDEHDEVFRRSVFDCLAANSEENTPAKVSRVLLAHGALVNSVNQDGNTPLHLAAHSGQLDTVRILLEHFATNAPEDIANICNARNGSGRTALHDAAGKGHAEVSRVILAHGALVDAVDHDGNTPLDYAAQCKDSETIRVLSEHRDALRGLERDSLAAQHSESVPRHGEDAASLGTEGEKSSNVGG